MRDEGREERVAPDGCEWVLMRSTHVTSIRNREAQTSPSPSIVHSYELVADAWAVSLVELNPLNPVIEPGVWLHLPGCRTPYFVERVLPGGDMVAWFLATWGGVTEWFTGRYEPVGWVVCDAPGNADDLYQLIGWTP